uniref:Uncharacterized protein n=2 Tax=Kalanchoe fedtschenkoi TaxID=63787 RepID=A0A7N0TA85_KALFE
MENRTVPDSEADDALRRLSSTLDSIFDSHGADSYSDAKITVRGREVAVHRCILSARSAYFRKLFAKEKRFEMKDLAKEVEVGYESLANVLAYLYSGRVRPRPKDVSTCVDDECSHIACRPAVDFMVEVLYAAFTFEIVELIELYQNRLLQILDKVAIDDMLVVTSVANKCNPACQKLLAECIRLIVRSDVDVVTLEKALPAQINKKIFDLRLELGVLNNPESNSFPDKHVKRIHRALESDDVELVRMLLKEGHTTLDDACALHYAVAYCDPKTTAELLDLGIADVNLRNSRGYTVLHVAAIRKEPKIIVSLLTKGAQPSDLTSDGRKALHISKRLTKAADYYKSVEEGKSSPKDKLCIEVLEQAERRDPLLGEASLSLAMAGDDLRMKLLYLEYRVGLAKLLFPMEAKVAMDIAQVDGTSEFPLTVDSLSSSSSRTTVDLNDAPFRLKQEHLNRMGALSRTVELGKRFFPRCSEVLNKIMDSDDIPELAYIRNGSLEELAQIQNCSSEERLLKRRRCLELQEQVIKAFSEDKEEIDKSGISISSSSSSNTVAIAKVRPDGLFKSM